MPSADSRICKKPETQRFFCAHLYHQDEGFDSQRQLTTAQSRLGPEHSMGRLDVFMSLSPCDLRAALSCQQPSRWSGLSQHLLLPVLTQLH